MQIEFGLVQDAELPPFVWGRSVNLFGDIEEPIARVAAIVAWAENRPTRTAYTRAWVRSWSASCTTYVEAILCDEWFYLNEPHCMKRYPWSADRFAVRGTELWMRRDAELRRIALFLSAHCRGFVQVEKLCKWLRI